MNHFRILPTINYKYILDQDIESEAIVYLVTDEYFKFFSGINIEKINFFSNDYYHRKVFPILIFLLLIKHGKALLFILF